MSLTKYLGGGRYPTHIPLLAQTDKTHTSSNIEKNSKNLKNKKLNTVLWKIEGGVAIYLSGSSSLGIHVLWETVTFQNTTFLRNDTYWESTPIH